jgi:hypothetical protein
MNLDLIFHWGVTVDTLNQRARGLFIDINFAIVLSELAILLRYSYGNIIQAAPRTTP